MRDEIRDHSAEKMLFIRRAVIAFLLVVICFAILILNLTACRWISTTLSDAFKPERH
jgi:cell division protein FtsI/penicillin-binding protein 2